LEVRNPKRLLEIVLELPDPTSGRQELLIEMGLIEDHDGIQPQETCFPWAGSTTRAITPHEKPACPHVWGRTYDGTGRRIVDPATFRGQGTAQFVDDQWIHRCFRRIRAQCPECLGDVEQDAVFSIPKGAGNSTSTFGVMVHQSSSIDDDGHPPWQSWSCFSRYQSICEDEDINDVRLA